MLIRVQSLYVFFTIIGVCFCVDCSKSPIKSFDEYDLRYTLFCKNQYDPHVRPVKERQEKIHVNVSLDLKYIELDDFNNHFWVHSWVVTKWFDKHLTWKSNDYNISYLQVSSDAIWLPDLSIFNSDMSQIMLYASTDCVLLSTGMVKCAPDLKAPMYCDMQLRNWPYDRQNCSLYIGSWANAGDIIDIAMEKIPVQKYSYMNSNAWELLKITPSRQSYDYPNNNLSYPFLRFDFEVKRHASLYAASIIGPAFALSGLTLVSFLLESLSVRCVLCCASFLGDALFLQYVGYHLPADGDTSPIIVTYYRDALLLNVVAIFMSILVDQMRAAGDGGCGDVCGGQAPLWLVGAASFVRGRGGKAGQLLLGDPDIEQQDDDLTANIQNDVDKKVIPHCNMFATFVDRLAFVVFTIIYIVLLLALVP